MCCRAFRKHLKYIYTFSVVEFLVLFCVWYWLFSDMNFFVFHFLTRTFFSSSVLFTKVVVVVPSHYDIKVCSSASLFTDLCSQWLNKWMVCCKCVGIQMFTQIIIYIKETRGKPIWCFSIYEYLKSLSWISVMNFK